MQIEHSSHFVKTRHLWQLLVYAYLMQNLRLRGRPPPIIFARIVRPMNPYNSVADSFHRKKFQFVKRYERKIDRKSAI